MTLEEAIKHCEGKASGCSKCADEHRQLAEWLRELKVRREMDERGLTMANSGIRFDVGDDKIKAEIDIDFLAYLFDTNRENFDGEKPAALVRPEQKLEFAKAVVKQLQEQSQGERDCIRWAEPIEDIFGEFLEEDQSFLKYGVIDGFTDKEIEEWKKRLQMKDDNNGHKGTD